MSEITTILNTESTKKCVVIVAVSIEAVALFPWYTFLNMIISESILFPIIDA